MRILTRDEQLWVAAVLDTDGYITARRHFSKRHYRPEVGFAGMNHALIEWFAEIVGKHITIGKTPEGKPYYRVRLYGREACGLLAQIYPYLVAKKGRTKLAIQLGAYNEHFPRQYMDVKRGLALRVQELNRATKLVKRVSKA